MTVGIDSVRFARSLAVNRQFRKAAVASRMARYWTPNRRQWELEARREHHWQLVQDAERAGYDPEALFAGFVLQDAEDHAVAMAAAA